MGYQNVDLLRCLMRRSGKFFLFKLLYLNWFIVLVGARETSVK